MPMVSNCSVERRLATSGLSRFEIQQGYPPDDTLDLRTQFVRMLNWLPSELLEKTRDVDRYDNTPATSHFAKRGEDDTLLACMRLTPVDSIVGSLSYEMLAENPEFQQAVAAHQSSVADGKLWDLTRLCFSLDKNVDRAEVEDAMIELFGMGHYVSTCDENSDREVQWIFTTTPWMVRFFDNHGIAYERLGEGLLTNTDGSQHTTLFCRVDVRSAVAALEADPRHEHTYRVLQTGFDQAYQSQGLRHVA